MTKRHIPRQIRQRVSKQAQHRCGYCLRTQELTGSPMTIDHITPEAAGGSSAEENLWLSCRRCNEYKATQTHSLDPETGKMIPLFNPRRQVWSDHFGWSQDGAKIQGLTPCGRATVTALKLNNPEIMVTRRQWVSVGWWPPED